MRKFYRSQIIVAYFHLTKTLSFSDGEEQSNLSTRSSPAEKPKNGSDDEGGESTHQIVELHNFSPPRNLQRKSVDSAENNS